MPNNLIDKEGISSKVTHLKINETVQSLITREDVKALVKKSVSSDAELVDFSLQPFSKEKLGYLGSHLCLVVVARKPGHDENETRSFFVKTLPYDVPSQAAYIEEKGCFRKETRFFELVAPLMTDHFEGESWLPKCYLTKADVMVFEDLRPQGFSNRIDKLLDEKSAEAALGCIARMHASSFLAEERIQGKSLKDLYPDVFEESEFIKEGRSYAMFLVSVNLAVQLANDLGLDSSNIRRSSERVFDVAQSSKSKRNVVSHGDLWSSNLIFDRSNRCRLVDFQMVRYSPPAHDIMLLLYYGTATEVRRMHERRFIDHYYHVLTETLKANNFKGDVPSLKELLEGIEELRLPALWTAVLFEPIVLLDSQTGTKIMSDPVAYEALYFGDRWSIVKEYMDKNPQYKKRIQDNIRELVKISLVLDTVPRYT